MAESGRGGEERNDVLVMTCLECGRDYEFVDGESPPPDLTCEKCGNQVFRRFDASRAPDEVQEDFEDMTERDLATDDPGGDATPGDLHDLNNP